MEPLPSQGQTLRHFTASRPRPRRTHTQPPSSRTQDSALKSEDEATDGMGRVDEGVEEFFTKRIIPDYSLKGQWEESNPAQAPPLEPSLSPSASTPLSPSSDTIPSSTTVTPLDSSLTCSDVPPSPTPASPPSSPSVTSPSTAALPSKNIKKKFGDFFAFKRPRTGRAAKAGGGEGGEAGKVKRTSIADLIRPLREAKDRDRERVRDKHRDANLSNDAATTEGTSSQHLDEDAKEAVDPDSTSATAAAPRETAPSRPTIATTPDLTDAALSDLQNEGAALPPFLPECAQTPASPRAEQQRMKLPTVEGTVERRVKKTFREGKSQSLILLSGLEPEDKDSTHSKKCVSDGASSFEHRLQVMLHRMGVTKTPPADSKHNQNKDEELRKANSEGAILEKPGPPVKPRTMSTSSADPKHPVKVLEPIRPDFHPKPVDRPSGPLPPKPAVAAKPPLPMPTPPAGDAASSSSAPLRVQLRPHPDTPAQSEKSPQGPLSAASPRKDSFPPSPSPWSSQPRSEKAQSVAAENLLKPRPHLKPLTQRRAVSVHEDALTMTQELKSVLQRSPVRFRGNRGDLPTFKEDPSSTEEVPATQDAAPSTGAIRDARTTSGPSSQKSPEPCTEGSTVSPQEVTEKSVPEHPCKVQTPLSTSSVGPETLKHPHVGPKSPRSPETVEVDLNSTQRTVEVILTRHTRDKDPSEPRT